MTHLLELYGEKKHFLTKFCQLNSRELSHFAEGNFDGIEAFYYKREKILEIIQSLEEKIELIHLRTTPSKTMNQTEKMMADSLLVEINKLTQTIIKQDMDSLSLIEAAKSAIIRELQLIKKNKKSVSSYKTKVDHHQIDEEI